MVLGTGFKPVGHSRASCSIRPRLRGAETCIFFSSFLCFANVGSSQEDAFVQVKKGSRVCYEATFFGFFP